eukprot:scaffold13185_cov132-Cylindrotheca_fusiformis.AAC.2
MGHFSDNMVSGSTLHIAARYIWLRNDLDGIEDLNVGKASCGSKNRKTFDDLGYSLPKGRYLRRYSEWIYVVIHYYYSSENCIYHIQTSVRTGHHYRPSTQLHLVEMEMRVSNADPARVAISFLTQKTWFSTAIEVTSIKHKYELLFVPLSQQL